MSGEPIRFASNTPEWAWLSNFHPSPIASDDGDLWPTAEHAFQGLKTDVPAEREHVRTRPTPGSAKAAGRRVTLREGWDTARLDVMRRITRWKFTQHADLRARLLATGERELVHAPPRGDRFWGVRGSSGENWQGRILMEIRAELRSTMPA